MNRPTIDWAPAVGSARRLARELSTFSIGGCVLALIFTYLPYVTVPVSTPFKYQLMGVARFDYLRPRLFLMLLSAAVTVSTLVIVGRSSRLLRWINILALLLQCCGLLWIAKECLSGLWSFQVG